MPDKKEEKEELKIKKPTEVSVEVGYTNESAVQNSSDITAYKTTFIRKSKDWHYTVSISNDLLLEENIEGVEYNVQYKDEFAFLKKFSIDDMKERIANGTSISTICNELRSFITENKNANPDYVQYAIMQLLKCAKDYYDDGTDNLLHISGYTRASQGTSTEEILSKIVNVPDGEQLHGFVCSTISEFGMHLLEECGIKTVLLCGGSESTNHTTLLWQRSDGKYVQSNYGSSYTLESTNIKDAAREVYKRDLALTNNGYIYFVDSKGSYQEFDMKDEAVWGDELDKRDYNNQSVFNHAVATKPSLNAKVNYSNLGSVSAEVEGTLVYGNDVKSKETSFALGYKKSGATSLADSSTGVGAKFRHIGETLTSNGKKFSETKIIADVTKLHTNQTTIAENYFYPYSNVSIKPDTEQAQQINNFIDNINKGMLQNMLTEEEFIQDFVSHSLEHSTYEGVPYSEIKDQSIIDQAVKAWTEMAKERYENYVENVQKNASEIQNHVLNSLNYSNNTEHDGNYELNAFDTTHLTTFIRQTLGKEVTILKDGNIELTNAKQLTGLLGLNLTTSSTFAFGGDVRITGEEGLKLDVKSKNTLFSNAVSGGVVADFALKNGTLTPTVSPGIKLNASSVFRTRINNNTTFGAGADAYAVVTRPSSDYGFSGHVQATHRPNNSDITLFGSINAGVDKQQIRIGGFNEQTENITTLGASLGAQIGNNTIITLNYNGLNNKLNSTKSRDMFSISAKVNL